MSIAPHFSNRYAVPESGARAAQPVMTALRQASQRTGVDFAYLVANCAQESGFDPQAKAATSSATGLFQFIDRTWLDMVQRHGAKYGVEMDAADPRNRREILELRKDPTLSALMAAEYTRENKAHLEREVGGRIGSAELYMAHFLGAGGAARFLTALRDDPDGNAAALLPEAASANRAVFYDPSGRPRSVSEVYDRFAAKFDEAPAAVAEALSTDGPSPGGAIRPAGGAPYNRLKAMQGEPLSLFTVMVISQLGLPGEGTEGGADKAKLPRPVTPAGV